MRRYSFVFACWRSHSLSVLQARAGVHIKMGMSILHWFLEAVLINTLVRVHLLPWVLHHCQFNVKFAAAHLVLAHPRKVFFSASLSFLPFLPPLIIILMHLSSEELGAQLKKELFGLGGLYI